jgi:hypothetical protein
VNFGDPVWPAPRTVELPRLLGGVITVTGYPLPMVFAEKVVTALQRGTVNTRWRDFADIYLLAGRHPVAGADLARALTEVAGYRQIELSSLADTLAGYARQAQPRWAAWRRKERLDDRLPAAFADVVDSVLMFAEPAVTGGVDGRRWDPISVMWR